ncbi:leucyl/phenylalanyl-tRNA--protein transferase [Tamlana sedimentorum]|uniref:Leucyl/phenylalanyl-tRNA--protein transferase n=1 Tax=Neotamlana sedimentorum TaxID=1435349 RepID=A0A0D7WBY3_9FLAO|nr:leucyl/phenylalanyl-tRNA--protein transferase [Tamlana sedimentorum]KJD35237.1 leucyl/phenylalanyl-tRNA--protein transferase [Tamlana sedimentorum]
MYQLTEDLWFPDPDEAHSDGLLAIGGDLTVPRLLLAYKMGIFPWYDVEPILWWAPNPRFVLYPQELKISKSMRQVLRNGNFNVTVNKDFKSVITQCALTNRKNQDGTWITKRMIEAYTKLHELGYAKSIEVWQNNVLVGGLYGVDIKNGIFYGESMFTKVSNASKVGFVTFIKNSNYALIDCQVHTKHLESLGAKHVSGKTFFNML